MDEEIQFSQSTLQDLCIAILNLRNSEGKHILVCPKDVLQSWILEQLPECVRK